MSRSLNNFWCLLLLSALTAALLWLAPTRSVRAAVYTYNARQRTINAGVLFVGSASDLAVSTANTPNPVPDPAPYVFYVLDQRQDVKPVGWNFVNPLAQSTVTPAMITRWNQAYKTGDSLTPTMASYWEVPLHDISADDLQQFDVLYLAASYLVGTNSYSVTFTPADNEKLRRFVDNGGQLIVEYGAGTSNQPRFMGVQPLFDSATWALGPAAPSLTPPFPPSSSSLYDLHPLITQPNFLQLSDFLLLGASSPDGSYGTVTQATNIFGTVLLQGSKDGVDAAQLGGGQIVTSALNIGPTVSISQGAFFGFKPFFLQAPYYNPAAPSGPYGVSVVPSVDLKFLSNVISWADAHPNENKTSHQNASGPSSASFTAAWAYPDPARNTPLTGTTAPPGAAVWGSYVFVTDSTGVLHAFDAIPDEFLTSGPLTVGASADDVLTDFGSSSAPTPYDEVWKASVGANASAPTVGNYSGATYVFVEKIDGSVVLYNNVTGAVVTTLTPPPPTNGPAGAYPLGSNAPAPTYYDGRIYAGQPNGDMYIYSLNNTGSAGKDPSTGVTGARIQVNPTVTTGEYATASPAVGVLASGAATNSIVALVPTTQNMNTVLLGARNDPLVTYYANDMFQGYNVNRLARYSLPNLFVDTNANPIGHAYDSLGNVLANMLAGGQGQDPVYPATNQPFNMEDQFGDWDIDFRASTGQVNNSQPNGMTLTLHEIKALSLANTQGTQATLSAPAIDRHGDYYYTVDDGTNSYLFGVHDDIAQRNVRLKFRFRLPIKGDVSTVDQTTDQTTGRTTGRQWSDNPLDADNVNYDNTTTNPADSSSRSLMNFRFVGAPVVDGQGNIYVAAQLRGGGPAAVLSFSADQEVTAEAGGVTSNSPPTFARQSNFDATQNRYFQLDEFTTGTATTQNPLVAIPQPRRGAGRYGQMSTAGSLATVFNFGRGSGGSRQIAGNLCEPQPFTATPTGPNGGPTVWMYFHTNLAWYATFAVNGAISGLSKAGNTLMLCDSGGPNTLYKLPAAPTVGVGKLAALTVRKAPLGTGANGKYLSIGTVTAAPSAGGGAMVVNGATGLAAFNQQLTLIADNNRILEVDADGNAVWSADATTRVQDPTNPNSPKTKVDFAHPSALAQFAPNDYLVADTGNNRCVRFDRGGNVVWELTRFYDPSGLMAPGQPYTLSQPTSVEVRREVYPYTDPVTQKPQRGQIVHYLVADSGNDRIVEVTDTLDPAGNVLYFNMSGTVVAPGKSGSVTHDHLLTWVTHTGDKSGRRYHYAGASYLDIPSGSGSVPDTIEVFALVTNTRVAQPSGGQLAAASADAPGGSIVGFKLPTAPVPFSAITSATRNDLIYVATSFTSPNQTGTGPSLLTFPVRNPRYLHVFAPPQGVPANSLTYAYSFLYADDNGAFDLVYQPPGANGQMTPPTSYGLAFTQADYRSMSLVSKVPADFQGNVPPRGGAAAVPATQNTPAYPAIPAIPFVPTCVQRLNDDDTNTGGTSHIERYLITQSYSQGELGTILRPALPPANPTTPAISKVGGEIFEVDVSTTVSGSATSVTVDPVGGFAGAVTLSRPVGASPLTQPTFAIRTTQ